MTPPPPLGRAGFVYQTVMGTIFYLITTLAYANSLRFVSPSLYLPPRALLGYWAKLTTPLDASPGPRQARRTDCPDLQE